MDEEDGSVVYGFEFSECIWEEFQEKGESNMYLTKWRKKMVLFFMRNANFYQILEMKGQLNWYILSKKC